MLHWLSTELIKLALAATVAIGVSGALLAWRERPTPGAVPLAALLSGQCWWSICLFFQISAATVADKVFWVNVSWLGVVVIPVAWLFFCLDYTGHNEYLRYRYVGIAAVIPAVTVVLALTDPYHNILYLDSTLVSQQRIVVLNQTPGVWYWVIAAYTYLLGALGAISLLRFISSSVSLFASQSLALLVGLVTPWATNLLYIAGVLPTGGFDPTPIAFSISGVAYLGALTRFSLFEKNPTPIRPARHSIFDRMEAGAIVLDNNGNIVDMNHRAGDIIESHSENVFGNPIDVVLPELATIIDESSDNRQQVYTPSESPKEFDVSVNRLTDNLGRDLGRIITLHDITDLVRQQQRLTVLNRVLRHNIRTNVQMIVGHADLLATTNDEADAEVIQEEAFEIEEISNNIRRVINLFEQGRESTQAASLGDLLTKSLQEVQADFPSVMVHKDWQGEEVEVDAIFEEVFHNILENAAEHNTSSRPRIWIELDPRERDVRVTIRDNGPGIDDGELALIKQGKETPLNHGSGFGLALAVWGTELAGGDITFGVNEPTGTTVSIDVPKLDQSLDDAATQGEIPNQSPIPDRTQ